MRAIVNTDVLVSGFLSAVGPAARVLDAWARGVFTLCIAPAQRAEVAAVLARPTLAAFAEPMRVAQFLDDLVRSSESLERIRAVNRVADPAGNVLLGLAEAAQVDVLVVEAEEGGLRALKAHGVTRIVSAREFALELAAR